MNPTGDINHTVVRNRELRNAGAWTAGGSSEGTSERVVFTLQIFIFLLYFKHNFMLKSIILCFEVLACTKNIK